MYLHVHVLRASPLSWDFPAHALLNFIANRYRDLSLLRNHVFSANSDLFVVVGVKSIARMYSYVLREESVYQKRFGPLVPQDQPSTQNTWWDVRTLGIPQPSLVFVNHVLPLKTSRINCYQPSSTDMNRQRLSTMVWPSLHCTTHSSSLSSNVALTWTIFITHD